MLKSFNFNFLGSNYNLLDLDKKFDKFFKSHLKEKCIKNFYHLIIFKKFHKILKKLEIQKIL